MQLKASLSSSSIGENDEAARSSEKKVDLSRMNLILCPLFWLKK